MSREAPDREEITAHIRGLFEAFLRRDRETIRRGHTQDWRGFQVRSRTLVRGIDEYMKNADEALQHFDGVGYEIQDIDIQVHGELAVVFYLATYTVRTPQGGERPLGLRSCDIYRREPAGWNQCGSNICLVPAE